MKRIILMVLLPCLAFAGTDCTVAEFPDHYEAVCVGDEPSRRLGGAAGQAVRSAESPAPKRKPEQESKRDAVNISLNQEGNSEEKEQPIPAEDKKAHSVIRNTPAILLDLEKRQHRPTREQREAARASRKKLMMEGRNEPTAPQGLKIERSGT